MQQDVRICDPKTEPSLDRSPTQRCGTNAPCMIILDTWLLTSADTFAVYEPSSSLSGVTMHTICKEALQKRSQLYGRKQERGRACGYVPRASTTLILPYRLSTCNISSLRKTGCGRTRTIGVAHIVADRPSTTIRTKRWAFMPFDEALRCTMIWTPSS